jgi:putative ABC transport system substrate-binding protein
MKRRQFVLGMVGAASTAPFVFAQPRPARIGILLPSNPEPFLGVFRAALARLGYAEGRNIAIELRVAEGNMARLDVLAAELVRLRVDIIVTNQTPAATAAARATREIPIVMAGAGDPVATGLVASLARPGGNITGMSAQTAELAGKMLELTREALGRARSAAILANAPDPFTKIFIDQFESAARALAIELRITRVERAAEMPEALAGIARRRPDFLIVQPSLPRARAIQLALEKRLPPVSAQNTFAREGGLLDYGGNSVDIWIKSAGYVDRILKGANPADLPVQQPTKFDLGLNLRTAKRLGIEFPVALLERATEIIE